MSEGRVAVMNDAARDGELDLGAVGRTLMRKKWWIFGPALAVAALTFVGVNLITPKYKSEARILIEGRENVFFRPEADKGASERDRTVDQEAVTSQVQLALSRDLARQVIKELKLGERPEFDSTLRGVSLIRYSLGFLGLAKDPLSMTPEERVLEAYYERLTVFPVDKSRVISIEFQSSDPELAARVANAVADNYLALQQTARQDQTRAAGRWLSGEIDVLRKKVAEAEAKMEEFRAKTNFMVGANGTTLSSQTLGEGNRDLATARSQRTELESKARFIREALKRGGSLESSEVLNSERLRSLNQQRVSIRAQLAEQSSTLLDNHPRIKELKAQVASLDRQIREEALSVANSFETDAKIAGDRVEAMQNSLDQLKRQVASSSGDDVELRALEREAKAQRDLLESYLAKFREATARDSLGAAPGDARIISRAVVSNTPFFPKKMPVVLIATLATLFMCAGFITTGELLAGNVYRGGRVIMEPAAETIAEPVIAPIEAPVAKRSWLPKGLLRAKAAPQAPVEPPMATAALAPAANELTVTDIAQALRQAGEGGKRIAVLGAAAGIGTTMTAVAIARELARDSRVILIDLSLDRPKLAAITADPRAPGISDLVRGTASFAQIITRDRFSRVQVIPAGRAGLDAAAVLGSERLVIAFDALARTYDHIVIDASAAPHAMDGRIARLAPCAVLVATGLAASKSDAIQDHLVTAGFSDIAVFTGMAPALDPANETGVAA
ncbi:MAG: tyrosine-protein kinase Etk/Wzc [Hyphomicrobiales bacterium]|nr:tyrosine-protein kinase Etk/Wzc [Hyphomicrobiales bacterium]